jgi:hypothetical protein
MSDSHLILVGCQHSGEPSAKGCLACEGSGFVKVVVGQDGQPRRCEHANTDGKLEDCLACLGSGWAGISD